MNGPGFVGKYLVSLWALKMASVLGWFVVGAWRFFCWCSSSSKKRGSTVCMEGEVREFDALRIAMAIMVSVAA